MEKTNTFKPIQRLLIDAILFDVNNLTPAYLQLGTCKTDRADMQRKMALRWWRSPAVKAYRATRTTGAAADASKHSEQQRSKADIIAELNKLISVETDSKRRGDLLMKLSDLLRENPANAPEESHVSYYLPLRCDKCKLYEQFKQAARDREIKKREGKEM